MKNLLEKYISGKKILILGFGKEGVSSYRLLRKYFPNIKIAIADKNENPDISSVESDKNVNLFLGKRYSEKINSFDIVFKSPGVSFKNINIDFSSTKIVSQTSLFLEKYSSQVVGITGTKGKSTTASLVHHILSHSGLKSVIAGNIGLPPFDVVESIEPQTPIVFEMSANQLEFVAVSPFISVLLNLFEEHLDHFGTFGNYAQSKLNIIRFQKPNDFIIYNKDDEMISKLFEEIKPACNQFSFSLEPNSGANFFPLNNFICRRTGNKIEKIINLEKNNKLTGVHNLNNILAAVAVCAILKIDNNKIATGLKNFKPLEHRLEYVGNFGGIDFYNDSISTVPEATIEAVKAIGNVDTLILGGFDRGIDYSKLALFLSGSEIRNFIFMGDAGKRILNHFISQKKSEQKIFTITSFDELPEIIFQNTKPGAVCLLSPAASSYDMFGNFEERGKLFKSLVRYSKNVTNY